MAPRHFQPLDATRGLAALLVFPAHIGQIFFWRLTGPDSFSALLCGAVARHAVLVFFLLSGHLVTKSIVQNVRRKGHFDPSEYVASRIARIYPPLIGAVSLCILLGVVVNGLGLHGSIAYGLPHDLYRAREAYVVTLDDVIGALTMRGGLGIADGALWTLFIEIQIYVLALAIAVWWQRAILPRAWAFILGIVALHLLMPQLFFVAVWAMGAVTVFWLPGQRLMSAAMVAAFVVCAAFGIARPALFTTLMDHSPGHALQFVCCIFYCGILFKFATALPSPRVLVAAGGFSYSLYIIHFPLLLFALSLSETWIGYSYERTVLVTLGAATLILVFTIGFARLTERQSQYKRLLLSSPAPALPPTLRDIRRRITGQNVVLHRPSEDHGQRNPGHDAALE